MRLVRALAAPLVFALGSCSKSSSNDQPANVHDASTVDVVDATPDEDAAPKRPPPVPVEPMFIGSGGFGYAVGSAFVGAATPQGMMKVGPDTKGPWGTINFLHCSGYWYGDDVIQGFSHLHLHGTGATDYGVLTLMPTDAITPASVKSSGYESTFAKSSEHGSPGNYRVKLDRGGIEVELTGTRHVAHHRYTYPASATSAHVIFDLDHHLSGGEVKDVDVTLDPATRTISGKLRSVGQMSHGFGGYDVFFKAQTKQPWASQVVWTGGGAPAAGTVVKGSGAGFAIDFDLTKDHSPIEVQVAISLVSEASAAGSLRDEMPGFAFDETAKKAAAEWDAAMGVVKLTGGTAEQRGMMTAALYHTLLMPTIFDDGDGSYRAADGTVQLASGFHYVSDMSLWDSYRTLHPFYALVAPDRARDAVRSLVAMARARGSFPRWPIATGEAGTMIGASAEVVIADAYLKGVTDFDAEWAYGALRAAAMDATAPTGGRGGRDDVELYMKYGYVPASHGGSVSRTIEDAQDDFALGSLAHALGHDDDATKLFARAKGYRALFDPATGYLWPKKEDGAWSGDHLDETKFSNDFVEANAAQTVWGAPYDLDALATLMGGRDKLIEKLQSFFEQGKADYDALDYTDVLGSAGMRPYYWAGNEPDIHAVYMFALAGRPELTQKWVRWIITDRYGPGADGLPGNDDGGTMSAWLLFSALGVYPLVGTDLYVIGAPLFPHAELSVKGGTFTIDAPAVSNANLYVQSVTLDGAPLTRATLKHADLHAGGALVFTMGPTPSAWGH